VESGFGRMAAIADLLHLESIGKISLPLSVARGVRAISAYHQTLRPATFGDFFSVENLIL